MTVILFFSQIPARTAHCNKMTNYSRSKVKIPMTTTKRGRGQSAATKESVTQKARTMVMLMGYKPMAIDKASWETSMRVAAG